MPASWTQEQLSNARMIIDIGHAMGMSNNEIQAALVAAMQESSLRNLSGGDRDSAGLFQQRPSMGWGTHEQVTTPDYAIRKFYEALSKVPNRRVTPAWMLAQAVQRSAYPTAYRKWLTDASIMIDRSTVTALAPATYGLFSSFETGVADLGTDPAGLTDLTGVGDLFPTPAGLDESIPVGLGPIGSERTTDMDGIDKLIGMEPTGVRQAIIDEARKYLGDKYVWGGFSPGAFDCSGLIYYVYRKLGIKPLMNGKPQGIPRVSVDQAFIGTRTGIDGLQPGDFVVWGDDAHHIAIYLGDGRVLEAPNSKSVVRERSLGANENVWGVHLDLGGGF